MYVREIFAANAQTADRIRVKQFNQETARVVQGNKQHQPVAAMGRKSKQPGGHKPLTYHERTKKFASSEYGSVSQRLAGHSQYQLGDCALSVASLIQHTTSSTGGSEQSSTSTTTTALCSPSGYLYQESAIVEYLLKGIQECKRQRTEWLEQQQLQQQQAAAHAAALHKRKVTDFEATQRAVAITPKKAKTATESDPQAQADLKRVSYWLASSQPAVVEASTDLSETANTAIAMRPPPPPERPGSPMTGQALRRKDLWPVRLRTLDGQLVCAVSQKSLGSSPCVAYWTTKSTTKPNKSSDAGEIVLESVYKDLQLEQSKSCPLTDAKIRHVRTLQQGGTSFASSKQRMEVQKYRPTIT